MLIRMELHLCNTKMGMLSMKREVWGWKMWKSTVLCGFLQRQEWVPISGERVAVLTEIWLIRFSAAQEWLSVIWLTIRHSLGSELFADELTGSSKASSLLHPLVFPDTFSVQYGCRCEGWYTNFDLFYFSGNIWQRTKQSKSIKENVPASEFIGNDLKGLLSETPTGNQPVLTASDNFSKYEIEQAHKHKKTLTVRDILHSPCWSSVIFFFFFFFCLHWIILGL